MMEPMTVIESKVFHESLKKFCKVAKVSEKSVLQTIRGRVAIRFTLDIFPKCSARRSISSWDRCHVLFALKTNGHLNVSMRFVYI